MIYNVLAAIPCQQYQKEYLERTGGENCRFIFCPELYGNWPEWEEIEKNTNPLETEIITKADIIIGEPPLLLVRKLAEQKNSRLKWIQMTWAGTDIYTRQQETFPEGIRLTNMSGAFGTIIAEYVMGAVLSIYRNFSIYKKQQEKLIWKDAGTEETLEGKKVLIMGTGDIGIQVAKRMKAFDAEVVGFRRKIGDKPPWFDGICGQDTWKGYLAEADVVVGCLPNTAETEYLLKKEELLSMKKSAILINIGRGNLIRTSDLETVMMDGRLGGVVLDVTDPEPLPKNSPLWNMERVMITPHISGASFGHCEQTTEKIIQICGDNLVRYLNGQILKNEIR